MFSAGRVSPVLPGVYSGEEVQGQRVGGCSAYVDILSKEVDRFPLPPALYESFCQPPTPPLEAGAKQIWSPTCRVLPRLGGALSLRSGQECLEFSQSWEGLPSSLPLCPLAWLVTVFVWASPKAGSEIKISAQRAYLGSGARNQERVQGKVRGEGGKS